MIGAADAILRRILLDGVPALPPANLSFQPPNEDWRTRVGTNTGVSVNVYLAEIEEDRTLRSNANERVVTNGVVHGTRAPVRIQLTYFVSAWNAHPDSPANPLATEAEHDTLSFVLQTLLRAAPFNASRVLPPAQLALVPPGMREVDLPTTIAAAEAHDKLSQFWGTMGRSHPHKPVIPVMVTVPVTYPESIVDGVVLSIDTELGSEHLLDVGGHVRDATGANAAHPVAVGDAVVAFATPSGRFVRGTRTGGDGSFVVDGLPPGAYRLSIAADGRKSPPPASMTLPTPSGGSIELLFT
jgi:hypothetical protein